MNAVIAAIDAKDRSKLPAKIQIYSEKLGLVEDGEFEVFFNEFDAADKKFSKETLKIRNSGFVSVASFNPIYAITLQRGVGNGAHWSAWMIEFRSNEVARMRRADEMWPFAGDNNLFHSLNVCSETKANG